MRLCKVCDLTDWDDPNFQEALAELNISGAQEKIHRKYWEFAMGLQALKKLDKIQENAVALGVGSGREPFMYYLANHIKHVYATDIYGVGSFIGDEAQGNILENPKQHAPYPYREDHLTVEFMDARYLLYDSNTFDIAFSFSSIEHFGSRGDIKQAMAEIGRVLKPGGIAVIATEIILNDQSHDEFFRPEELLPCLVEPGGLELVEDEIDLHISQHLIDKPLQWDEREDVFPHITLEIDGIIFTSVFVVLRKHAATSEELVGNIDRELRLLLSKVKLDILDPQLKVPPVPQLNKHLQENTLNKIPGVGWLYGVFRQQFHNLVIYYVSPLFEYLRQFSQHYTSHNSNLYLIERLLLKSELTATRAEMQSIKTKIEALEQQLDALTNREHQS